MIQKIITSVIIRKLMRICAKHDDVSDTNKISTALNVRQYYCIILRKIMSDKSLSGSILRICDYFAMSDNIIILMCNNHANI